MIERLKPYGASQSVSRAKRRGQRVGKNITLCILYNMHRQAVGMAPHIALWRRPPKMKNEKLPIVKMITRIGGHPKSLGFFPGRMTVCFKLALLPRDSGPVYI